MINDGVELVVGVVVATDRAGLVVVTRAEWFSVLKLAAVLVLFCDRPDHFVGASARSWCVAPALPEPIAQLCPPRAVCAGVVGVDCLCHCSPFDRVVVLVCSPTNGASGCTISCSDEVVVQIDDGLADAALGLALELLRGVALFAVLESDGLAVLHALDGERRLVRPLEPCCAQRLPH